MDLADGYSGWIQRQISLGGYSGWIQRQISLGGYNGKLALVDTTAN